MNLNISNQINPSKNNYSKGVGMLIFLFLLTIGDPIEEVAAQAKFNWEVGTKIGFTTRGRKLLGQTIDFPNVGEMEKQSDLWGPGLYSAIRRESKDSSIIWLINVGYNTNRLRYRRTESGATLGISWQQHDVILHYHYLTLGLGLEAKVFRWQSNALSIRMDIAYLFNFMNTLEWEQKYDKTLVEGRQTDRFYARVNRFDKDTEDFESNPFFRFGFQAAYEKDFGQNGIRVFVGYTILYQRIRSSTSSLDIDLNSLEFGAAFLF
ncbi:MAG: hypothetical protein GVX96_04880 [Bacteroidetes bacterium]|jgi:hypothetical protein|nr:hypothetical protein [Bacteroidota bacterium]